MANSTASLTPKQQQVYDGLASRKTITAIAKKMGITTTGVYGHMRNIRKAGVQIPGEEVPAVRNGRRRAVPADLAAVAASSDLAPAVSSPDGPEASLKLAINGSEDRVRAIDEEIGQLEGRIAELRAERDGIEQQHQKYTAALTALLT